MGILFLAYGLDAVSARFRIFQYLPYLRQRTARVDVADLRVPMSQRWRILKSAATYDTVVVHRAFLNPAEHWWLHRRGRGYVFDFDDAIMFRDSSHRHMQSWRRRWRFTRMAGAARTVIAGNDYLATWAARCNTRVAVIQTAVDTTLYAGRANRRCSKPVIGWIGTRINLMYLRQIAPALTRLGQRRSDVQLKIVCDDFVDIPGIELVKKRWTLAEEVDDVSSFAVGIMPLPDDPWTRGKCGVKILQYFAAGIPVVCSSVGANRDIVEHGRTGYFARTEEEWVTWLEELLRDPEKRRQFGVAAREVVQQRYSVAANADKLAGVLLD